MLFKSNDMIIFTKIPRLAQRILRPSHRFAYPWLDHVKKVCKI